MFHIFGNNLKIGPVRAIKIRDGTTPHGDLSYDTLFAKTQGKKEKDKKKKKEPQRFLQFALDSVKAN